MSNNPQHRPQPFDEQSAKAAVEALRHERQTLCDEIQSLRGQILNLEHQVQSKAADPAAQLAAIVASSDDAIIGADLNGTITSWNDGAQKIFGYDAIEVIGKSLAILCPSDEPERLAQLLSEVSQERRVQHREMTEQRKDGTRIVVSVSISPIHDAKGRVAGIAAIARDLSGNRKAEQELHDVMSHVRCMLWHADIHRLGATRYGPKGLPERFAWNLTLQDEQAAQATLALDVAPGQRYIDVWMAHRHPDDWAQTTLTAEHALDSGAGGYTQEFRCFDKNGNTQYLFEDVTLQPAGSGQWKAFGVVTNITLAKAIEENLRDSDRRLRMALEAARMGWWERELRSGKFTFSDKLLSLFDLKGSAVDQSGQTLTDRIHPDDRAAVGKALTDAVSSPAPYHTEYRVTWHDGSLHWLAGQAEVIRDASGKPTHLVGITIDITDRKNAELERAELLHREQAARTQAENANRSKDQFLAVLSHELRTPLTPVLAKVGLMKRQPGLPPEMYEDLEMIRRNAELEARLIGDLVDVTNFTHGRFDLKREAVDIHEKIQQAVEIYLPDIASRQLQFKMELNAAKHIVNGDAVRLQQIFWNLIGNAVKYTPPGGSIAIRSSNRDPDILRVQISDTGIGIEPDFMPKLFNAFQQAEQTLSRRFGGLGLGLSICKMLVDMHGGSLQAASAGKNQGSTFTVELKTVTAPTAQSPPPKRRPAGAAPRRVLLVEDNADTLRVLARLLKLSGYEVRTAMCVREALEAAESAPFDVLVSDVGLPDGTGWELMQRLRARGPVRGVALSGFVQKDDVQRSRAAGFLEHLAKPITAEALEAAIERTASAEAVAR